MRNNIPFGYEMRNGKLVPNETESEIIKYRYEKGIEYNKNPPEELINKIIEEYAEYGETLTHEEAQERVTYGRITDWIWAEIREKWKDYFAEQAERMKACVGRLGENKYQTSESTPIVSREEWEKAQAAMSDQGDDEPTYNSPTMKL